MALTIFFLLLLLLLFLIRKEEEEEEEGEEEAEKKGTLPHPLIVLALQVVRFQIKHSRETRF